MDPEVWCRKDRFKQWRPLHFAALEGHVQVVEFLLDQGVDGEATIVSYTSPLHLAALNGHSEVAALLLKRGADAEAVSLAECHNAYNPPPQQRPLHLAAKKGHAQV